MKNIVIKAASITQGRAEKESQTLPKSLGWIIGFQVLYKLQFVRVYLQAFPKNLPRRVLRYLQLSTGSRHRFPRAPNKTFTHSLDGVFGDAWVFLNDCSLYDRCSLCREIVHIAFGMTTLEDQDVQIAVGTADV
jgi:hypothetical protein